MDKFIGTLQMGDSGEYVKMLNMALKSLEYKSGESVDEFDARTFNGVEAFQNDYGIKICGVVDEETWNILKKVTPDIYKAEERINFDMPNTEENMKVETSIGVPSYYYGSKPILKRGATGDYVVELQHILKRLGFLNGESDGIFGSATDSAVRSFQESYGLTSDGIVGQNTWDALEKAVNELPSLPPESKPTLRIGSRNIYVKELQIKLDELGFYEGPADGIFGKNTETAVKAFQAAYGLNPDGVVGPATWRAIEEALPEYKPPQGNAYPTLRPGSNGEYVWLLQNKLRQVGYYNGINDGFYGDSTEMAVREFQKDYGLTADGIVGPKTWVALDKAVANSEFEILSQGDSGSKVVLLQDKLKRAGYLSGNISGTFNKETVNAVKKFQIDNKVSDGIVGAITWQKLFDMTQQFML